MQAVEGLLSAHTLCEAAQQQGTLDVADRLRALAAGVLTTLQSLSECAR